MGKTAESHRVSSGRPSFVELIRCARKECDQCCRIDRQIRYLVLRGARGRRAGPKFGCDRDDKSSIDWLDACDCDQGLAATAGENGQYLINASHLS